MSTKIYWMADISFSLISFFFFFFYRKVVENWERKHVRCIAAVVNLSTEKLYYANALGIAYLTDTVMNEKR